MKYFISYRRRATDDKQLAEFLAEQLKQANHEVFIDLEMKIGTDWVAEIGHRIDWCDFLVVLISADSINSEMVQGEIRNAHQRRKTDGTPKILPIRINYEQKLDYELDSYIGRLQYLAWKSIDDNHNTLTQLLDIAKTGDCTSSLIPEDDSNSLPNEQISDHTQSPPKPQVDPRVLRAPGGSIRVDDPAYIKRPADVRIELAASSIGETIVIKAPRQMGKSSLLIRYLAECKNNNKALCYLDFQSFTNEELDDYENLLTNIASSITRSLRLQVDLNSPIKSQQDLTYFLEDHVISSLNKPLVLAFDEVDRVLGRDYQSDFFSMFRHWHNRRADPLSTDWAQVDIALVIATEPYILIDSSDRSPFNVTPPINIEPFSFSQVEQLNQLFGAILNSTQLIQLHDLLSGHPYLTRLAFYRLTGPDQYEYETLLSEASSEIGPFSDHLRHLLMQLEQAELTNSMKQIISHQTLNNKDEYFRLHGAGLAKREGNIVNPTNLLYTHFFKAVL